MRRGTRAFWAAAGLALCAAAGAKADAGSGVIVPPIIIVVNGWVQSFASGTAAAAPCTLNQTCISATGRGEARFSFTGLDESGAEAAPNLLRLLPENYKFSTSLTIDSGNTTPNGFGGTCSAAGGTMTLSAAHASELVLDLQGTECAVGNSATEKVLNASWVVEHPVPIVSSGASGTGSFTMSLNSAATPTAADLSFSGHLDIWQCPVCAARAGE